MRGAYVALPTMATSNQMFGRVRDLLGHRYADEFVQLQLLHGHASLSEDVRALQRNFGRYLSFADQIGNVYGDVDATPRTRDEHDQMDMAAAVASSWFTGRKQGLLSPFGVGTIDQLLLAVLPVKHFFVRLFGLSNKTVILDEVHAYDAYMTTLMERLLGWLAAMGCHVILLSATLPAHKRARLLVAYQSRGRRFDDEMNGADQIAGKHVYPCVRWVGNGASGSVPVEVSPRGRKALSLRWLEPEIETLAAELDRSLADGGCAAVICNTVRRAQEVYQSLQMSGRFAADELDLFHARFLLKDRQEREMRCLRRFGKPNSDGTNSEERPPRMVLVATQVIEQSLDLDFDLMISDLAPVDLLLQRAGRLHRHERSSRASGLETPTLWIIGPNTDDGVPKFERGGEYIYSEHILLRTWWELKDRTVIAVPDDVAFLIEAVYDDRNPPTELRERWYASAAKLSENEAIDGMKAEQWRIRWPGNSGELAELMPQILDDEDAESHPAVRAQTRLGEPTVTVVCYAGQFRAATFEPDGPVWNLGEPSRDLVRVCLENSVSISRRDVTTDLLHQPPPKLWARNSFLRTMRPYALDQEGGSDVRSWRLVVDPDLGVLIVTEKGA